MDELAPQKIRDAASIILVRDAQSAPKVLMGQRGAKAAFMPSKFVFPGGAVDDDDARVPLATDINPACAARLAQLPLAQTPPSGLPASAIRELWEETGLLLSRPGNWPDAPPRDWAGFAAKGVLPDAAPLHFVFRAITPPKRPRRFDARFFLADAAHVQGDPDDFSAASDELSHLQWIDLHHAGELDLPFITEVVLAEIRQMLPAIATPARVPFFDNRDAAGVLSYL